MVSAKRRWAPLFTQTPLSTNQVVAEADFPMLAFHGTTDDVIPIEEGRALATVATSTHRTFSLSRCQETTMIFRQPVMNKNCGTPSGHFSSHATDLRQKQQRG